MDLEQTLEQFDAVETNLSRLEKVWEEMQQLIPSGIAFEGNSPANLRFIELGRAYVQILKGIPPVEGYSIQEIEADLDNIAHARLAAKEEGGLTEFQVEDRIDEPTREIAEYRSRFRQARFELVRPRLQELIAIISRLVSSLADRIPNDASNIEDPEWGELVAAFEEVERLGGSQISRVGRWWDLQRHISFAEGHDLHDIANLDWPSVRGGIESNLYSELEPVPAVAGDLTDLVRAKPTGTVTTKLKWDAISAEEFERLLFNLISDAEEYTNPQWLMQTNAPDRGRDLSVERVITDALSGTQRQRVMIQAKHWIRRSVRAADVAETLAQISLWEPPLIQSLVIATSGRFTNDAVAYIEKHNNEGKRPHIEMWPESHLELLLARRPHLVAGFNLRP